MILWIILLSFGTVVNSLVIGECQVFLKDVSERLCPSNCVPYYGETADLTVTGCSMSGGGVYWASTCYSNNTAALSNGTYVSCDTRATLLCECSTGDHVFCAPTSVPSPAISATPTSRAPTSRAPSTNATRSPTSSPSLSPTFLPLYTLKFTTSTTKTDVDISGTQFLSDLSFYNNTVLLYSIPAPFQPLSVSMNDNSTVIGMTDHDGVYIWTNTTTTQLEFLNLTSYTDVFLPSLMNSDGTIYIVGKTGDRNDTGAFYSFIYGTTGWTQTKHIVGNTPSTFFGSSLAISRENILVVSSWYDENSQGSFWVYRYSGSTWIQEGHYTSPDVINSVTITEDSSLIAVGGYLGQVSVFQRNTTTYVPLKTIPVTGYRVNYATGNVLLVVTSTNSIFIYSVDDTLLQIIPNVDSSNVLPVARGEWYVYCQNSLCLRYSQT